jgi:hypothetical protein
MTIEKLKEALEWCCDKLNAYELSYKARGGFETKGQVSRYERYKLLKATLEAVIEQATPDDNGLWSPEFVSTLNNPSVGKVDMYRLNGEGKTLCTLGVPHGDKNTAKKICDAINTRALITAIEEKMK